MDCTIVSTLPFALSEPKPGLVPSHYLIPAAPKDGISVLHVNDGFHLVLMPLASNNAPPIKIVDLGEKIAQSLINDYTSSCLAVDLGANSEGVAAKPGLFWVKDTFSVSSIEKQHPDKVKLAKANTRAWFKRLVVIADDDWSKYKQHKMITDIQREACTYLDLEREWNFNVNEVALSLCWSCKSPIHPQAMVCSSCKAILNAAEFNKRKTEFATQ